MNRPRVLLADDHRLVAEGLRSLLAEEFELVGVVEDGRAMVAAAKDLRPDVIVTDISMPHLNGAQVISHLRKQGEFAKVPILAITAYGHYAASQSIRAGADRTMIKPLEANLLISSINEMLGQSKAA